MYFVTLAVLVALGDLQQRDTRGQLVGTEYVYQIKLGLHDAICRTDSFVFTLGHCVNFKAMRYESTSFNRIVADKSHLVKPGLHNAICLTDYFVFALGHCVNFKAMRYVSTGFNRIVADKLHLVTPTVSLTSSIWN